MSKAIVTERVGGYTFKWEEERLEIQVSQLKQDREGIIRGEILITTSEPSYNPHVLRDKFNFSSSRIRATLEKQLGQRYPEEDFHWHNILEVLCEHVVERFRKGEAAVILDSEADIQEPGYLLRPFVPLGLPTVFFGEGGSGKSYLALLFGITASLPWEDNPIGFVPAPKGALPLYLDWEQSKETINWRLKQLVKGCALPYIPMPYRFCSQPLSSDLEPIREAIAQTKANFLIIDSLGPAAGGDLNTSESAISFFTALHQLKMTAIIVAHLSKDMNSKRKTIFGSVYFWNLARSIVEVKACQDRDIVDIGLFHRKANTSALQPPLAMRLRFNGQDNVSAQGSDVRAIPELAEHLSLGTRIREALKGGPLLRKDLAESLSLAPEQAATFNVILNREKLAGRITQLLDKRWALAAREDNEA